MKTYSYLFKLFLIYGLLSACTSAVKPNAESNGYDASTQPIPESSIHIDSSYKYEFRTGESGDFDYNYDVVGEDEESNEVEGNVTMSGKYGHGTITNEDNDDVDVDVEWIGYGQLEATDDDGNVFTLRVK